MIRHEGRQVRLDTDRAHTRATTTVRNAESLVQVQVAHIRTNETRRSQTDLGVHVGAVHVHLTAVLVNDFANFLDVFLVDTVRRRVRNHESRQVRGVLFGRSLELGDVDVTLGVGANDDDLHAAHRGGRRVGTVRGNRDDAHVTVVVTARLVVGTDTHQTSVLTRRTRVRLEGHGVEAGDLAELLFETAEHLLVTKRLIFRRERVNVRKLRPRDRNHFSRCVELHRARAESDHGVNQGEILLFQALEVAHHLVFTVVLVEHRVGHEFRLTRHRHGRVHRRRNLRDGGRGSATGEHLEESVDVGDFCGFVKRQRDVVGVHLANVDASGRARLDDGIRATRALQRDGVEELRGGVLEAKLFGTGGEDGGKVVRALGDLLQALRTVVNTVHGSYVGQQRLRGANVRSRLVTTDVLLARLHRHAKRRLAFGVDGLADDAARHQTLAVVRRRQEGSVRTTVAHGHAESLR